MHIDSFSSLADHSGEKRDRNIAIYLPVENTKDKNLQNKGSNLNSRSHSNCYGIAELVTSPALI